ncbi:uncharacterized protein LOC131040983 [Cryptomeria japonica]|uniref:uncharacterized protein LOC131040983 n=1 Tax=Cryptomeria japonica TaxID=3369 RepID=UPI0027D9E63D|nr:uncharacterized protein LOC131040983 [Cryptomeria japonica]XP_057829937.2 uncharacterized protein LOC131040983 [Cryptomeria japonica]
MEFIAEEGKLPKSSAAGLILPALSIGNAGQLAVDLLVSSRRALKIGYLDDPYVLPCVGNDAYGPHPQGDLAVALEVYEDLEHDLCIIQQRSPVMKGTMIKFAKNLSSWASAVGKKEVIIISSLDSGKMQEYGMNSQQIHYISSAKADGTDDKCEELGWKKLEQFVPSQKGWQYLFSQLSQEFVQDELFLADDELTDEDYFSSLPFASLFSSCQAKGLKVTCLFCFCSEGDNMRDAFVLAEAVYKLLGLCASTSASNKNTEWVIPLSWKSVYGPGPDISIF